MAKPTVRVVITDGPKVTYKFDPPLNLCRITHEAQLRERISEFPNQLQHRVSSRGIEYLPDVAKEIEQEIQVVLDTWYEQGWLTPPGESAQPKYLH